jgi:predicted membrane protein
VGLVVNAGLLFAINDWPGWNAVPFLTEDTTRVLGLVNASIVVGLVANALYVYSDPPWFKALGDTIQNVVGVAALVRIWTVFPLDFAESSFDWDLLARWVLGVGIAGSGIGILVGLVALTRARDALPPQPPQA